ncbi:hypothetical protein A8B78_22350 [Jannaschia sp. EhC01]|nr:hypothetical protein A8B78_22350 [Jannaschia sp. EhC01]
MRTALTLISLFVAAPVFAGGVTDPAQPPLMIDPPVEMTWTGFYAGANVIYGQGTPTGQPEIDGLHYGLVAGYRQDLGDLVIGVEVEWTNGAIEAPGVPTREMSRLFSGGLEVGYDAGVFLPYATAGVSTARFEEPVILPNFDASGLGYFFGVGVDYALNDEITLGAEIIQHRFTDFPLPNTDIDLNTVSLTATFNF